MDTYPDDYAAPFGEWEPESPAERQAAAAAQLREVEIERELEQALQEQDEENEAPCEPACEDFDEERWWKR